MNKEELIEDGHKLRSKVIMERCAIPSENYDSNYASILQNAVKHMSNQSTKEDVFTFIIDNIPSARQSKGNKLIKAMYMATIAAPGILLLWRAAKEIKQLSTKCSVPQ